MSGDVVSLPDPSPLWEAHEHPDRPLDPGAMLCSCVTCEGMILAQAERTPGMGIALATGCDRVVVAAEYLAEVMAVDRALRPLLYVRDDYVRRLYLPLDRWWFFPPERWWSQACRDDEEAAGRRHPRHRVAKRQSDANRLRCLEAGEAASARATPVTPVRFVPVAEAVHPWRQRHRTVLAELGAWALACGRSVDLDLVALILAARETGFDTAPPGSWTRTGVHRCVSIDVPNWCTRASVLWPEGVPAALWQLLDFLVTTGRLDRGSDPIDELRKPLMCYGGLDRSGRERGSDADRGDAAGPGAEADDPPIRCECYVRYRGPTHGELADLAAGGARLLGHARPLDA
jgi:hypothetical protein